MIACAAKRVVLVPAPNATLASAPKFKGALGQQDGVRIIAAANEWDGRPHNLYKFVTPLRVQIENHSGHALQISYGDFRLTAPNGKAYVDLPPTDIRGHEYVGANYVPAPGNGAALVYGSYFPQASAARLVRTDDDEGDEDVEISPDFDWDGFYLAPYWGFGYYGMSPWPYTWAPDYGYYNQYYPYMHRTHLPTRSMLRRGIPEGVIANGGHITGFLYFSRVGSHVSQVELVARLVDAKTQKRFGRIEIPFVVRK